MEQSLESLILFSVFKAAVDPITFSIKEARTTQVNSRNLIMMT